MNKKGVLDQLGALVVPLIVVGLILVIGLLIMAETKSQALDVTSPVTKTNTTNITVNTTSAFTCIEPCVADNNLSITAIYNASGIGASAQPIALSAANYTITNNCIAFIDHNYEEWGQFGTTVAATYSCNEMDYTYNATRDVQNATNDIPGWLPIIVITVIGALLIGLVALFRRQ